ncbi:MAG: helix-turn-helix transcriptional regulator [Kofleriaceae bacterium]
MTLAPRAPGGHGMASATSDGQLTEREREIVASLASGQTAAQIATSLVVSCHTVKTHIRNVYLKLGISNRVELMMVLAAAPDGFE